MSISMSFECIWFKNLLLLKDERYSILTCQIKFPSSRQLLIWISLTLNIYTFETMINKHEQSKRKLLWKSEETKLKNWIISNTIIGKLPLHVWFFASDGKKILIKSFSHFNVAAISFYHVLFDNLVKFWLQNRMSQYSFRTN